MNEIGELCAFWMLPDEKLSHSHLKHLSESQESPPKVVYVDNCCDVRNIIKSAVGESCLVKLDALHGIRRLGEEVSAKHPLRPQLLYAVSAALFHVNDADMMLCDAWLEKKAAGLKGDERAKYLKSPEAMRFRRRHCRRHMRENAEMRRMLLATHHTFSAVRPYKGRNLMKVGFYKALLALLIHVDKSCLSDPDPLVQPIHLDLGPISDEPNAPHRYLTMRGTSALEGFHRHLVQMLVGDYCSPEFADAILFPYIHRWNMQRRISYGGEVCVGTMDITVLDAYASYSLLPTPLNNSSDSGGDFYVPTSLLKPHNMAATPFGCCGPLTLKRTAAAIEARGAAGAVEEEGDGADSAVVTSAQQDGGEARATASLLLPPDEEDAMFGEEGGVLEEEIPYEDDIPIDLLAARTPPPPSSTEDEVLKFWFKKPEAKALRSELSTRPPTRIAPAPAFIPHALHAAAVQDSAFIAHTIHPPPTQTEPPKKKARYCTRCHMPRLGHSARLCTGYVPLQASLPLSSPPSLLFPPSHTRI